MPGIFSKIINGDIPCYKIGETKSCFAFLDINPIKRGHILVIPKKEVDYLFDLEKSDYQDLMDYSRTIALALKKVIECKRIGVMVLGMEIPHAHIHLVPINTEGELSFGNPKAKLSTQEFQELAAQINSAI